jgi:hypothetical protein
VVDTTLLMVVWCVDLSGHGPNPLTILTPR